MIVSTLVLAAAGSMSVPTMVFANTPSGRREDRQDAREGARDIKQND